MPSAYSNWFGAVATLLVLAACDRSDTKKQEPFSDTLSPALFAARTDSFGEIDRCLDKGDVPCACALAKLFLRDTATSPSIAALHGQCLLRQGGDAREALRWLELARNGGIADTLLAPSLRSARKMLTEAESLGELRSLHFDLQVEDKAFRYSAKLLSEMENAYDSLCLLWKFYPEGRVAAVLYSSQIYRGGDSLPDWTGALFDGKVRIPANVFDDWPQHRPVIRHEVAHAFHRFLSRDRPIPTWLEEGLAQDFDGTVLDTAWLAQQALPDSAALESDFLATRDAQGALLLYRTSLWKTRQLLSRVGRDSVRNLMQEGMH